jgi:hypothetical protein
VQWVEQGIAPEQIVASKIDDRDHGHDHDTR